MIRYFCDCCGREIEESEKFLFTLVEYYGQKTQVMCHLCPDCADSFRKEMKILLNRYSLPKEV